MSSGVDSLIVRGKRNDITGEWPVERERVNQNFDQLFSDVQAVIAALKGLSPTDPLAATLASPALTGIPTAPTAAVGTNTTQLATTAFVTTATTPLRCIAYHNTTQSLSDNVLTALNLNSEDVDPSSMHDLVTNNNLVTIPAGGDGIYLAVGTVSFAANATGNRQIAIGRNGAAVKQPIVSVVGSGVVTVMQAIFTGLMVATDYFTLLGYQNSGGSLASGSATRSVANSLTVVRLGT